MFVVLATSAALGIAFFVVVVGAALFVLIGFSGIVVGRLERWRLRLVDLDGAPDPHRPPLGSGVGAWLSTRLAERSTWRELGFALLSATTLSWIDATVLGFAFVLPVLCFRAPIGDPAAWPWVIIGLVAIGSGPYMITAWAGARAGLTRIFLAPRDDEIGAEITDVDRTKRRLLNAFEIERVRIERDLHDGAQQRLVALGMTLGLTRLDIDDPALAARLDDAQDQLTLALAELRDLVRGLNPQVLTDNGLVAAIADSAGRSAVPISVDVCLPSRLPVGIETAAYYVVAEALTNIARHSQACDATVYGRHHTDILVIEISDNGIGGADPRRGTGLSGLADRLDVVDGRLRLSSPAGGPTVLRVEIPCRIE
ncbi:sensor histidine kinase [Rhodococcus sp. ABRD24]|uniref:sensor histidine kinase n=1 Tax=Rhodococcus sp. ABRD24 TaxID=2507582 RepID=UPI001F622816|nr:sensor histidine kinase [Rhodococcus sp. ABRD24]